MKLVKRIAFVVVFVAALVGGWKFRAANETGVVVDYLFGQIPQLPLWQVLLATFVLGALAGTLVCLLPLARTGLTARRYRRSIVGLEAEIHELRTLPLAPERAALGSEEDRMGLPPDVPAGRST
jgi:uncharacterized integral membrane protein